MRGVFKKGFRNLIYLLYCLLQFRVSTVMAKNKKQEKAQQPQQMELEQESQELSSEDEDAALLTSKVEEKLLSTLAKIKMKDPSIYQIKEPLYEEEDFSDQQLEKVKDKKQSKYTYKDLVKQGQQNDEEQLEDLPPVLEEKNAKEKFKKALTQNIEKIAQDQDDLFRVKTKVKSQTNTEQKADDKSKFEDLTKSFTKQTKKIIKKVWASDQLDETDLFLKNYILDKKWLSSKFKEENNPLQEKIDEEDQQRSQQMDEYQAQYNFRFQEPGGTEIKQYPRQVENSLRQKTETRREVRKKKQEKKKQQQEEIRKEAEKKKAQLRNQILEKIVPEQQQDEHDWFFCDDCCKAFTEGEKIWQCTQCEDYMLCDQCNQLIIHKHLLKKGVVPQGFGAPAKAEERVKVLEPCITCRRRITPFQKRYQYTDRNYIVNSLCQLCYDQSNLQIKKKYKLIQAKEVNYEEIIDQNPEKIKELTTSKDIEEMVDEYLKYDFEDVLSGGLKTKFKYIQVKPESFGLSDEQILFGDDKQLNKYISVKKLAPYRQGNIRLRNNVFKNKVKSIQKSVKSNKNLLEKGQARIQRMRYLTKRKNRAQMVKKRLEKKLKIVNLSTKEAERNHFVPSNRLLSYGLSNQQKTE